MIHDIHIVDGLRLCDPTDSRTGFEDESKAVDVEDTFKLEAQTLAAMQQLLAALKGEEP